MEAKPDRGELFGRLARCRYGELADALGDTPLTAIDLHHLLRGSCRVYLAGTLPDFDAAIIQLDDNPRELDGYGRDAERLYALLSQVTGWDCILVDSALAEPLGETISARTSWRMRYYSDVAYHAPQGPSGHHHHDDVRRLVPADLCLLESAPEPLRGAGFGSPGALLREGFAAGAVVGGRLVALAHTSAMTPKHGDIGVHCLEAYRGRGYATAAAWLVAKALHASGRTPIWSTGEDNRASQRVAEKLGFQHVENRVYLIPLRDG